jgi:hypothetical protein
MNVHRFDGVLHQRKQELASILSCAHSVTAEQKLELFAKLRLRFFGLATLNIIISDFISGRSCCNYDPTNELFADDLLYICAWIYFHGTGFDHQDYELLLRLQFTEMMTGMCVQGRTTRLFQIVSAYAEYFKPT